MTDNTSHPFDFYPSKDFSIIGQITKTPCDWCGELLGDKPHMRGWSCMKANNTHRETSIIAEELEFTAKLLKREACVFGEEPLQGALDRLNASKVQLEYIIHNRRNNSTEDRREPTNET